MTQELPEGTVTIVFTDVVGSTALTIRLGDEPGRALMREVEELVRAQVTHHRGVEVKGLGDGQMVAFTSARRAVLCAIDVQKALERWRRADQQRQVLALRIGLHTGEVIREQEDLFGAAVNFAARVASQAGAGEVILSETTKSLLGAASEIAVTDRGEAQLKGFPGGWRLFAVAWEPEPDDSDVRDSGEVPYVGRLAERAALREALAKAKQGAGNIVFLGGEPGIGKTRLASEVMADARRLGFFTVLGHCYETEGTPPFVPFVEAFDYTFRVTPPETLRALIGEEGPEIARLAPRLRTIFRDLPPHADLPPEQARHYLFSCIADYLGRAARAQPIVFVLDDLHWADDSTLLLFEHIAGRLGEMPLLIVGTYRDTDLDAARPFAATLSRLSRLGNVTRIAVRRFDRDGVEALLRGLSGKEPPGPLVDLLTRETEGVPLFLQELYRYLDEQRRLFDTGGGWRSDVAIGEVEVPEGVRLVIGRRLERLGEETRRVLAMAAAIGGDFTFELLAALSETGQDALLDAVDEATGAHLLVETSAREARYAFSHEQVRQTLLATLPLPRRQRLHLRVADAIEKAFAKNINEHAAEMAHHLNQAGALADAERTIRFLLLAGQLALDAAAFEDALQLFDQAVSLESEEPATRARLLHQRGLTLGSVDRRDEALSDWYEALDLYEALGQDEAAADVSLVAAFYAGWAARLDESVELARRGLRAIGGRSSSRRCDLLARLGQLLITAGNYAEGDGCLAEAVEHARSLGADALLGRVLSARTQRVLVLELRETVQDSAEAAALLRGTGDTLNLCQALYCSQYSLLFLGQIGDAAARAEELEPLVRRFGHDFQRVFSDFFLALGEVVLNGDVERCQARIAAAVDGASLVGWEFIARGQLAWVHFWRGHWPESSDEAERAAQLEVLGAWNGTGWGPLVAVSAYRGDRERALAILRDQHQLLPAPGQPITLGSSGMRVVAVEALAVLGMKDEAAQLYPSVQEILARGMIFSFSLGLVQRVAGIASACAGEWDTAEGHFETALRQAHEIPHKIEQPEVRRWYAWMLLERRAPGDIGKARQLLGEAIEMYRTIGMPKHVELAEALLARA